MNGLLFLIPIAVAMGGAGLIAFLWALKSGQFDDLDGAAGRILFDDPPPAAAQKRKYSSEPQQRSTQS
jgi:cbb3-type cytochrome oxidase maturation protein